MFYLWTHYIIWSILIQRSKLNPSTVHTEDKLSRVLAGHLSWIGKAPEQPHHGAVGPGFSDWQVAHFLEATADSALSWSAKKKKPSYHKSKRQFAVVTKDSGNGGISSYL
jgi:hypothetical protein